MSLGAVLRNALAENDQLDVADNGYATPGHWSCPEGSMVSDAAGDSGEMRVCGREEVECDMRGEDVLRKR